MCLLVLHLHTIYEVISLKILPNLILAQSSTNRSLPFGGLRFRNETKMSRSQYCPSAGHSGGRRPHTGTLLLQRAVAPAVRI